MERFESSAFLFCKQPNVIDSLNIISTQEIVGSRYMIFGMGLSRENCL